MVFSRDNSQYFSFAQAYKSNHESLGDGWHIYEPFEEYERQGLNLRDKSCKFKLFELNKNYSLCSTYPEILIVPKSISDEEIKEASNFRTKFRFPTLSYVYTKDGNWASIWRSSQTRSGITQNRSFADEGLLKAIGDLSNKLIVFDARPYLNALANRVEIVILSR